MSLETETIGRINGCAAGCSRQVLKLRSKVARSLPNGLDQFLMTNGGSDFLFPQLTHLGQSSDNSSRFPSVPMSDEEYKRLNDRLKLPEPE
jgi:hypothetical protein